MLEELEWTDQEARKRCFFSKKKDDSSSECFERVFLVLVFQDILAI